MRYRTLFAILIIGLFIMRPVLSYADWHGHDGGRGHGGWHGRSYVNINLSPWTYDYNYYYGAPYYPDAVLVSPPVTIVQQPVEVIQPPAVIDSQDQGGAPVVTAVGTTSDMTDDPMTINIPNDKGGYTAVVLKKSGNGFVGPQGEFYPEFPTVSHLKVIYGK